MEVLEITNWCKLVQIMSNTFQGKKLSIHTFYNSYDIRYILINQSISWKTNISINKQSFDSSLSILKACNILGNIKSVELMKEIEKTQRISSHLIFLATMINMGETTYFPTKNVHQSSVK